MCAITLLKACTLSRISSARVTFYIQNCFYSELLERKKNFLSAKLKKIISRNFQVSHWKKNVSIIFEVRRQKKIFRRKKNFDCKSPMKWPIYIKIFPFNFVILNCEQWNFGNFRGKTIWEGNYGTSKSSQDAFLDCVLNF